MSRFEKLAACGTGALLALGGCGQGADRHTVNPPTMICEEMPGVNPEAKSMAEVPLIVYVPTWMDEEGVSHFADQKFAPGSRLIISFGLPGEDGSFVSPQVSPGLLNALKAHQEKGACIGVGGGGWGDDASEQYSHKALNANWKKVFKNPDTFAEGLSKFVAAMKAEGLDLGLFDGDIENFEDLNDKQPAQILGLLRAIRAKIPGLELSLAVPTFTHKGYLRGDNGRVDKELISTVARFSIMGYDQNTPNPEGGIAGPLSSRDYLARAIGIWSQAVGDNKKLAVLLPSYGYGYFGAETIADESASAADKKAAQYTAATWDIDLRDIPEGDITSSLENLTSTVVVRRMNPNTKKLEDVRASLMGRRVIWAARKWIMDENPDIQGFGFWEAGSIPKLGSIQ